MSKVAHGSCKTKRVPVQHPSRCRYIAAAFEDSPSLGRLKRVCRSATSNCKKPGESRSVGERIKRRLLRVILLTYAWSASRARWKLWACVKTISLWEARFTRQDAEKTGLHNRPQQMPMFGRHSRSHQVSELLDVSLRNVWTRRRGRSGRASRRTGRRARSRRGSFTGEEIVGRRAVAEGVYCHLVDRRLDFVREQRVGHCAEEGRISKGLLWEESKERGTHDLAANS